MPTDETLAESVEAAIAAVDEPSRHALALAAIARETVRQAGHPMTNPITALNSLRATLRLIAEEARLVDDDGEADWAGIAERAGATPIRDEAKPKPGNAGRGGRRSS